MLVCSCGENVFVFQIVDRYGKMRCFVYIHNIISIILILPQSAFGQINMRDCRVETVDHVSDSDSEERDSNQPPTIALHPTHQGPPTYLLMSSKQEKVFATKKF